MQLKNKVAIAMMTPFVSIFAGGIGYVIWREWPASMIPVGIIGSFLLFVGGMTLFAGEEKNFP